MEQALSQIRDFSRCVYYFVTGAYRTHTYTYTLDITVTIRGALYRQLTKSFKIMGERLKNFGIRSI